MLPGVTAETMDQVIKQESLHTMLSALEESDSDDDIHEEEALQNKHMPHQVNDAKGMAVHFTHRNWELVVNIMMGIRKAVGQVMMEPNRPLCQNDYTMKEKMTIVNRGASEQSGKQDICRFIDYAPMVFRKLREVWGISAEEYMLSVGPQQILRTGAVGE